MNDAGEVTFTVKVRITNGQDPDIWKEHAHYNSFDQTAMVGFNNQGSIQNYKLHASVGFVSQGACCSCAFVSRSNQGI